MHFSIAETEECKDETGSYTLFKIHINGAHHCSVRYSQLNNLNDQLKIEFRNESLPPFPPKKLFSLSSKEKEERKYYLEKFLQIISQSQKILNSDLFINFFLNAQKETQREPEKEVEINVFLVNSDKLTLSIKSYDQTDDLLEKVVEKIRLNPDYAYYFGIFLVKKDEDDSIQIVRRLQDFESPYLSLKAANSLEKHRLLFRKSVMDLTLEMDLYNDDVATDLLYIQALDELSNGYVVPEGSIGKQLKQLQKNESKKDFLRLLSTQKFYGFLHFKRCVSDYPDKNTKVTVSLGNRTIIFRTQNSNGENEVSFKVTRIRCWKITGNTAMNSGKKIENLELSFEYLFSKNNLKWITLTTDHAISISMSLQNIVDEILLKKEGKRIKKMSERQKTKQTPFLTRLKTMINTDVESHYVNNSKKDFNENSVFDDETVITNDDL